MSKILYSAEDKISVDEFASVLTRSTLSERRPMDSPETLQAMLENADVLVTARDDRGRLVGISRALTDFIFCTYLSDLAVDKDFQGLGIGKELIHRTHARCGLQTQLILIAAPGAESYYPHVGLRPHQSCWIVDRKPT